MKIFKSIINLLVDKEPSVLATVTTSIGSAPRHAGTRMIVRSDGLILGTIGCGALEGRILPLVNGTSILS